ncbi:MAG: hypothetical protein COW30_07165 [Rhodospirillales bacterium CG15_BIG_FIL_POST_REV_8_21_14_020_66_15]|nr:MAG: hypothetical protein COW30_07165 [Rhodospirillales bacterium CG15_BIG_FIL_POST_REV_8_21_14_020_66_15]
MATNRSQTRWRAKNRLVKRQLNVMAKSHVHDHLQRLADDFRLRGKGEAVSFATFVTRALMQRADYSKDVAQMLEDLAEAFHRDRDIYSN